MQTTLTRSQFIDRPLRADDLQTVGLMLSDWFRKRFRRNATLHLTTTLWGFPQKQGDTLLQMVQETAIEQNVPLESANLCGADFLVLESVPVQAGGGGGAKPEVITSRVGTCLHLLQSGPFENLLCEITLSLSDGAKSEPRARRITLSGAVEKTSFVLKAVWSEGDGESTSEAYASQPWPLEAKFLHALTAYQGGTTALPPWARDRLFFPAWYLQFYKLTLWFMRPPRRDFKTIAGRVVMSGLLVLASSKGMMALQTLQSPGTWLLSTLPLAFVWLWAVWVFGWLVFQYTRLVVQTYRVMRAAYQKTASDNPVYVPMQWENAPPGFENDPAFRKLSQETEDVGGVFFQNLTIQTNTAVQTVMRVYLFPQNATVFILSFAYGNNGNLLFPANRTFHVRTNFADGGRLLCLNGGGGFRKDRLPPNVIGCRFANVSEPGEMLKKHLSALQKAEAQGRVPVPLVPETLIAQMNAESREYADASRKYGYFRWADAFRMVFDAPRREYAEDA